MIGSLRLTLGLMAAIVAGISGLLVTFWGVTSPVQAAARAQEQFSMAFAVAARAQPDGSNIPLSAVAVGQLPGNALYCPASGDDLEKGLVFVLVHPGVDGAVSTSCAQALTGQRQGDDLLKAAYRKEVGNTDRTLGNTDWLPENYVAFKAGQVFVTGELLNFVDDSGVSGVFQNAAAGSPQFTLKCPSSTLLILGMTASIYTGPAVYEIPSFCVDVDRTDLNLTQSEAQADCAKHGKLLISDDQYSWIAYLASATASSYVNYDPVALGLVPAGWAVPNAPAAPAPYVGRVKGSSNPAFARGGGDPNATADPASRRWIDPQSAGSGSLTSGQIWDFVGAPQWTSSQVALEDIGKTNPSSSMGFAQVSGHPDVGHLERWPTHPASLDPAFGVKNINYLYVCTETTPRSLTLSSFVSLCYWSVGAGESLRPMFAAREDLDAGWGGYFAATVPGVPLGVARGGPWPGTRMGSGLFAMAIVPVTERASHRCVMAPLERAGL